MLGLFVFADINALKVFPEAHHQAFRSGVVSEFPGSFYLNPATASVSDSSLCFSYNMYLPGVSMAFLSLGYPGELFTGRWGLSFAMVRVAPFNEYDEYGFTNGYIGSVDAITKFSWAKTFANMISAGASLGFIYSSVAGETTSSVFLDLGALFRSHFDFLDIRKTGENNFFAGVSVNNLGLPAKYSTDSDTLPIKVNFGLAVKPLSFVELPVHFSYSDGDIAAGASLLGSYKVSAVRIEGGLSYAYSKSLKKGLSFGFGVSGKVAGNRMGIFYAGELTEVMGLSHGVELLVSF